MAFSRDFSNVNQAIQRMMSFFMQNKLGELSNERYMGTLSEQDRLMRERSAQEDVMARSRKQYESNINVDEHIRKAFIDTAKSNDAFDYNVRAGQVAKEAGDLAKSKQHYGAAYELAMPNLVAKMNALKGKVSEQDILASMEAFGEDGVEKLMTEAGTNARFNAQLPIQKQQAATSAGNLALGREQFKAEQGPSGTAATTKATDYYKNMHTKISSVQRYLASMKDYVESGGDISQEVDWEKLLAGPTTPKLLGQALSKLSSYDTKSMKKPLTPEEEAWIDRAWDIVNLQEEEKSGGIGSTAYPAGAKQRLEADVNASLGADVTATAQVQSIHSVGEKKTVVINGVNATYIWDGAKWLLSDSK